MRGLQVALAEAARLGAAVVVAIVDHTGELVCYARQDRCLELAKSMSVRKAYTSAIGSRDRGEYAQFMRDSSGKTIEQHLGMRGVSAGGGVVIKRSSDGLVLGAIGVSGAPTGEQDEKIGRAAVRAM